MNALHSTTHQSSLTIPFGQLRLGGDLVVPAAAVGLVIFAHGSGSSRHSPRNQFVARTLQENKLATLLFDLLTEDEEREEYYSAHLRFDISLLAERLLAVTEWIARSKVATGLPLGYFGSSTGAGAALVAAAEGGNVRSVVSRGGRPDLAAECLAKVQVPVLLIVGGNDRHVIELNEKACEKLCCRNTLTIIPGATHLFEEAGALERVAHLASDFFSKQLQAERSFHNFHDFVNNGHHPAELPNNSRC